MSSNDDADKAKRRPAVSTARVLFAGGVAGAVSRSVTSPLERVKVLSQVQTMSFGSAQGIAYRERMGIVRKLAQIYKTEGALGFFKGNGANVVRIAPYSAIQFSTHAHVKQLLLARSDSGGDRRFLSPLQNLFAGGVAGATALSLTYPLDVARARLTIQVTSTQYAGIWRTLKLIAAADGMRGLFRGVSVSVVGIAGYNAFNFGTYETLKQYLVDDTRPPTTLESLGYGAFSGAVAQLFTYPIDLLRRRLQVDGMATGGVRQYSGAFDAARKVVAADGVFGLYRGMLACFAKVVPSIAVSWQVYELMRNLLGIPSRGGRHVEKKEKKT